MKLSTGCIVAVGLMVAAATARAQLLTASGSGGARLAFVSDFEGPYAELPFEAPSAPPVYGPPLLAPQEVYPVLRANGFHPLGTLRQRGPVYIVAAMASDGEDGRVVMDGRDGHIIEFIPAFSMGKFDLPVAPAPYGAARSIGSIPRPYPIAGAPRPPLPIPHVASRNAPLPKMSPPRAAEVPRESVRERSSEIPKLAAKPPFDKPGPEPVRKVVPSETQTAAAAQSAATSNQAKPLPPAILPTEQMPAAQGLE
jgi:hypothetical protein